MIADQNREGWIGASDTSFVVGNWNTKTWGNWWMQKLGINTDRFDNRYTLAGTHWEHRILDSLGVPMEQDRQILLPDLCLRVNLDGNTDTMIYECKTYQWAKGFRCPKKYKEQVQVQMYATGIYSAEIVAYGLTEADYDNYFRDIEAERRQEIPIPYDKEWIEQTYLPKLKILAEALRKGAMP